MGGDGHSPAAALSLGLEKPRGTTNKPDQHPSRRRVRLPAKRIAGNISQGKGGSDPLTGTWDYDGDTTYQFDGKGSGAMILTSATYDFSYQVKGDQLFIDFSNEAARDCAYTFSVNDNTLTLTGGEGTIGGTYELHRQEE